MSGQSYHGHLVHSRVLCGAVFTHPRCGHYIHSSGGSLLRSVNLASRLEVLFRVPTPATFAIFLVMTILVFLGSN